MTNHTSRVLKAENVRMGGKFHLDLDASAAVPVNTGNPASSVPQVRIVENNDEFAVIELICGCGTKICIRCEYAKPS